MGIGKSESSASIQAGKRLRTERRAAAMKTDRVAWFRRRKSI